MARVRHNKPEDKTRVLRSQDSKNPSVRNKADRPEELDNDVTIYRVKREPADASALLRGKSEYSAADFALGMPYTDKFTVRGMIGQGGTSRVLLGYDTRIGREVALKELLNAEEIASLEDSSATEMSERFEREIEIAGQLEHPGIVPVYEAGYRSNGISFYAMKYVRGKTLREAIEGCESLSAELSFAQRMRFLDNVINVCDAVAYAHSKGIIHRDLKPENIVIGQFGENVVIDWGLAKVLGRDETLYGVFQNNQEAESATGNLTQVDSIFGTPRYMAPEQAGGQTGKFSDVYSLGAVLFYVLTGKPAYSGTMHEVIEQLTSDNPTPSPRDLLSIVPSDLSAICEKAMAKNPSERFSDARELADQLHAYRDGRLISTYAYSRSELFRRFVSRNKSLISTIALVMIAVIGGAAAALKYAIEAHEYRERADAALVDVTSLSQMSIRHSQEIAEVVEDRLRNLAKAMDQSAKKLGEMPSPQNPEALRAILRELHALYPNLDHILILDADSSVQDYSPGNRVNSGTIQALDLSDLNWLRLDHLTSQFGRVVARGTNELYMPIQSPIRKSGDKIARLVALLQPTHFLSDQILAATPPGKVRPQAWLLQDDGLILFDKNSQKVGVNLYTDMQTRGSPSLQVLAIRVKTEETGIGYYSRYQENQKSEADDVAAWDTIELGDDLEWRVVSFFEYLAHD